MPRHTRGDRERDAIPLSIAGRSRTGHVLVPRSICRRRGRSAMGRARRHAVSSLRPRAKPPSKQRTYSHLMGTRRMPSEYEIVTSRLHWYVKAGFEVATPIAPWYAKWQRESPLAAEDWDAFLDPRETTYTRYVK